MSPAARAGLVAAAVALQAGLSIQAMRGNSATFDEGAHLPAGYTHLALLDHRLNPEQPPLVKLLAAAPLLAVGPEVKTTDVSWAEARQWEFGRRFLYRWNDADRLLFLGRLPVVALASWAYFGLSGKSKQSDLERTCMPNWPLKALILPMDCGRS